MSMRDSSCVADPGSRVDDLNHGMADDQGVVIRPCHDGGDLHLLGANRVHVGNGDLDDGVDDDKREFHGVGHDHGDGFADDQDVVSRPLLSASW